MKAILIARVSDIEQRKALPAQKLKLNTYAAEQSFDAEYYEFDESAHGDTRTKFAELVTYIKNKKEKCIVVFDKIDRFTRDASQQEVKAMSDLVRHDKIELHFPSDNLFITIHSPATDLFRLGIGMLLAKYYSDTIRDNVKRRFDQMLNDKTWIGYAPIGYTNIVLDGGTKDRPLKDIVVDTARVPHIVRMFEMRATGIPYQQIVKYVDENGLTSKSGKKITKSVAEKILKNPFYYGRMLYMGNLYEHKYEPLISRQLYNQVQAVREQRHDQHTTYDSIQFTFGNIAKCKHCGATVSPYKSRNNVYLRCSGGKGYCKSSNTSQKLVMPDIVKLMKSVAIPSDALPLVMDELKKRHDNQQHYYTQNIEQTRLDYDKVKEQIKKLTYERLDGRITVDLFNEIVVELNKKQDDLNEQLKTLTSSNQSFAVTASYLLDLAQRAAELFESSSERLQQKLLKFLLSNIELADKKLTYIVNDPYKTFIEMQKSPSLGSETANWCG